MSITQFMHVISMHFWTFLLRNACFSSRVPTKGIFGQFMTVWERQILARAVEIQNENWTLPYISQG